MSDAPDNTSMSGGTTPFRVCNNPSRDGEGPSSTSLSSSNAVERMISFARSTSSKPGSWTRIWCPPTLYGATIGSATPNSLTRRSIVCSACLTDSSRSDVSTGARIR